MAQTTNPIQLAIGVAMGVSALAWMIFSVAGLNVFSLVPFGTAGEVMITTLLGSAGIFDLAAKAGVVCYPGGR